MWERTLHNPDISGHRKRTGRPLRQGVTPDGGMWPLTTSGQPCTTALPPVMVFLSWDWFVPPARMSRDGRAATGDSRGQEGAAAFPRPGGGPQTVPGVPHPTPTPGHLAKVRSPRQHTEETSAFPHVCISVPSLQPQGFQSKKTQSAPCPPASHCGDHHRNPSDQMSVPVSGTGNVLLRSAFPRVVPLPFGEEGQRQVVCVPPLSQFSGRRSWVPLCDGVSPATVMNQTFPINN